MITLTLVSLLFLAVVVFFNLPMFGFKPQDDGEKRVHASPNFSRGEFQNLSHTPQLAEGESMVKIMYRFFFGRSPRSKPEQPLPSIKTNLKNLSPLENVVVWFGHSSYFIQADGKTILADPVFSGSASPVAGTKAYSGADVYTADDMPPIDYLFISHDHWDHLDYKTVKALLPKVDRVITGMGTGAHLEFWGYSKDIISELDWYQSISFKDGFSFTATPGRHFSGRSLKRNQTLWISAVLQTPRFKLFLGGDSGFDTHFEEIGKRFGPFDLAILECGQYNPAWHYIHMMPEEVVTAAKQLVAKRLLPVHWAKFSLALHDWDEPIKRVTAEAARLHFPTVTPLIGQKLKLDEEFESTRWWEALS